MQSTTDEQRKYTELYKEYYPTVKKFLYGKNVPFPRLDIMTREVLAKAFVKLDMYKEMEGKKFSGWLVALANNYLIDQYRSDKRHAWVNCDMPEDFVGNIEDDGGDYSYLEPRSEQDDYQSKQAVEDINNIVRGLLTKKDYDFYEKYFQIGYKIPEMTVLFKMTTKQVYQRINRIKQKIKTALIGLVEN